MSQYKITVPMPDGEIFVIDLNTTLDSPAVKQAVDVLNHATLMHDLLKKLVVEMAPIALIHQSDDYRDTVSLLEILEPL